MDRNVYKGGEEGEVERGKEDFPLLVPVALT